MKKYNQKTKNNFIVIFLTNLNKKLLQIIQIKKKTWYIKLKIIMTSISLHIRVKLD